MVGQNKTVRKEKKFLAGRGLPTSMQDVMAMRNGRGRGFASDWSATFRQAVWMVLLTVNARRTSPEKRFFSMVCCRMCLEAMPFTCGPSITGGGGVR